MQIRIITLAVILFLSPAQGAPRVLLNIQENTKRQLHYILFAIGNKKRGSYKNPQLIWEYLAMHN